MDFAYSSEELILRNTVREFAEGVLAPHAFAWDEGEAVPAEILRTLGQQGYFGSIFPERLGGSGLNYIGYCVLIEELARVDGGIGLIVAAHTSLCANHIFLAGTERQRDAWLPRLASGRMLGCWCLTEPHAGSDAGAARTTAEPVGGGWALNGLKTFATNAHIADLFVVMAVSEPNRGSHGISAFIVNRDATGLRVGRPEHKMGLRTSSTSDVVLDGCSIPADALLGPRGDGFVQSMKVLDGGRVSIAALSIGMAQGAYEAALAHAKSRTQFGRPIADFQMIQQKLADMAVALDAARLLTYRAAWLIDNKKDATRASATAKLFASEAALRIADEALQIHGGYGYLKSTAVEKIYRDVRLCTIGEGTSEIQRLIIARRILADRGDLPLSTGWDADAVARSDRQVVSS